MGPLEGTGLPFVSGRATFNECWCELQLSRELKTLVARSRERFFMAYRTSGEACLSWVRICVSLFLFKPVSSRGGFLLRARAKTPVELLRERGGCFVGRPLCLRSIHKTSASERKRIHIGKGFQPPRERRKKRVDVENFRPFLEKFEPAPAAQKSRTAHSCAYKKLNYRN